MDDTPSLPNDLAHCQRLLRAAFQQAVQLERQAGEAQQRAADAEQRVAELTRVLDATAASYRELQQEHAATLDELAWHKRWAFGRRRERVVEDAGQGHLFELDTPLTDTPPEPARADEGAAVEVSGYRRRKRRTIDWDKLVQIRHEHDLDDDKKICACCGQPMECIGEDVTRELEYQPAILQAHVHVRPKYACRHCREGVVTAPLPARPIPGGIAGPGLLAEVIVSKFSDHLPLYRLEDILVRYGVYLSRSTLCDWVKSIAGLLQPLYDLQRQLVLQSSVMWTDDTYITVLGGREGSFRGYFWTYIGDEQHPYSVYDFTNSRTRAGPTKFLEHYVGYLHADAYTGYDAMFLDVASGVQEVACWAHARRKFFDAIGSYPREAHQVLEWIWQLSDIEDRARPWSAEARQQLRVAEANPVLDKIEGYLAELAVRVLPKSSLAKAVTYARNQWQALRRYTVDGRLTLDNNVSERTLRHQAIGRNYAKFRIMRRCHPASADSWGRACMRSSHNHRLSRNCSSGLAAAGRACGTRGDDIEANAFFFASRSAWRY
jgi:transposase